MHIDDLGRHNYLDMFNGTEPGERVRGAHRDDGDAELSGSPADTLNDDPGGTVTTHEVNRKRLHDGLADLDGWHFVTGPLDKVRPILAEYGVSVTVPTVGMISHSEGIYFLNRSGAQVAYLADGANARLNTPYSDLIRSELGRLLG